MLIRLTAALAVLISVAFVSAFAETRFDITSRLNGYDLVQATGSSSKENDLPPITVASGSEGLIQLAREFRYPKGSDNKGRVLMRIAYLGIRLPIYVRQTEDGNLLFLLRAELCERLDVNDPVSPVSKTTSSVQGVASPAKMRTIIIGAPGGKQATLEITFTPR